MRKIFIVLLVSLPIFILSFSFYKNNSESPASVEFLKLEKIKIAVCPTYYKLAQKLELEKYQIIFTNSTAESLALLRKKQADLILAGRTLKPWESNLEAIIIKDGYSFISREEKSVYISDLRNYDIYSDLDIEKLRALFLIENIKKVTDIYEYLDKGIVITSWENTDYNKANIIHLLAENGERIELSRRPTLYCPEVCTAELKNLALLLK